MTKDWVMGGNQVITDSRRLVWWLWVVFVVWSVVFGPGIPALGIVQHIDNPFATMAVVMVGACLLSLLVAVSLVRCLTQRVPTFGAIAAAVSAVAIFCLLVGVSFWTHAISQRMTTRFSFASEPALLDRMQRSPNDGRFGARMTYRELGLRIAYRDKAGATAVFEPTSTEQKERRENVAQQRHMVRSLPPSERDDRVNHVSAWILALSFPLVFTLYLLWLKKRGQHQANDEHAVSRPNLLVALWAATAAWCALFGLPRAPMTWIGRLGDDGWWLVSLVGAFALSIAVTTTLIRSLTRTPWTYGVIAAAAGSFTVFFLLVGTAYFVHGKREEFVGLATQPYAWLTPGKLDGIHELKNPKNRRLAARVMFHEFGWHTGYRDEAGAMVAFEPTADEQRDRAETVTRRKELEKVADKFVEQMDRTLTFVWLMLATLPLSLAVSLLWRKRKSSVGSTPSEATVNCKPAA